MNVILQKLNLIGCAGAIICYVMPTNGNRYAGGILSYVNGSYIAEHLDLCDHGVTHDMIDHILLKECISTQFLTDIS